MRRRQLGLVLCLLWLVVLFAPATAEAGVKAALKKTWKAVASTTGIVIGAAVVVALCSQMECK